MKTPVEIEEMGKERIPKGFHKITLGKLVTFQRGHDLPKNSRKKGNYPVVASNGIVDYHTEFKAKGPGVTIGRSGNIGEPLYIEKNYWPLNTTLFVKEFHNSDPKFTYYFLKTLDLNKYNSGSAVPSLNRNYIHPIEVVVPETIEHQQKISLYLSSLDDKIDLNNQMNSTLEQIAQTLFKRWFIDFEFPDENGNPYKSSGGRMVDSELGEIPEGWGVKPLYDCAQYINGAAFKSADFSSNQEGLPIIKISELKNGVTSQTEFTKKELDKKYRITNGEILFSWSGSPDTSIDIFLWAGGTGWLNQHTFRVVPYEGKEKEFIFLLLKKFKNSFIEIARNKQTTGLGHVTSRDLKNMLTAFPTKEIITRFNDIGGPIIDKIFCNSIEFNNLSQIRDSLLPKLISGKIRVSTNSE
ncbi:restriction endonuclease subunit S [Methanosarcina sp. 2.H.A.1B.4]|uniref:restriction endonuclease subunit S n=1 Tax=Methanosarcina sp. 2.H.A.1B.4 TaxID=1483600 RepID=UPI000622B396|nr:restriction endonuclease subunit S [Methanosarcina sp. 2.H.A.1B.4]KKG07783.1 hypothetical protein EO92_04310 [Methanosarcina sp. 2.H.A.1B.4]